MFFTLFAKFSDKNYLSLKGFEPVVFSVRDQDATTVSIRHKVIDRLFKLTPIHASVIYQIP